MRQNHNTNNSKNNKKDSANKDKTVGVEKAIPSTTGV